MEKNIISYDSCYIQASSSTVGNKEHFGPLGNYFDLYEEDEYFGCNNFQSAETEMARRNMNILFKKADISEEDISLCFGGDLLNQCAATNFALRDTGIPYIGLYGACSTIAESLICASVFVDNFVCRNALCMTSSHFCSAERQYRFPLEYGSTRTPTSQNTVTGAGAYLISRKKSDVRIEEGLIGKIIDSNISDPNNMGAAMANAAADTITRFFCESRYTQDDFDVICTGDLGFEGLEITKKLLESNGLYLSDKLYDCGEMIYDREKQDCNSGGSGCGCMASVLASYFIEKIKKGELSRILAVGTGALHNPCTILEKKSIPAVAHAVNICGGTK